MKIQYLLIFALVFSCGVHKSTLHKKKIQTTTVKEDFTVTTESANAASTKTYYWYKSNEIHQSKGDYSGDLLHGNYAKHYITNELAEKGEYNKGLKDKQWRSWFKNGQLKTIQNYRNGELSGDFALYSDTGNIITSGKYSGDKKTGQWVDYIAKDTINYKKGRVVIKQDSLEAKKAPFFKRLFKKKEQTENTKTNKREPKQSKPKQKVKKQNKKKQPKRGKSRQSVKKQNNKQKPKKDSFLKRLFSKKDKKNAKS